MDSSSDYFFCDWSCCCTNSSYCCFKSCSNWLSTYYTYYSSSQYTNHCPTTHLPGSTAHQPRPSSQASTHSCSCSYTFYNLCPHGTPYFHTFSKVWTWSEGDLRPLSTDVFLNTLPKTTSSTVYLPRLVKVTFGNVEVVKDSLISVTLKRHFLVFPFSSRKE